METKYAICQIPYNGNLLHAAYNLKEAQKVEKLLPSLSWWPLARCLTGPSGLTHVLESLES